MKWDGQTAPGGTFRDWLDFQAAECGDRISHIFPEEKQELNWSAAQAQARRIAAFLTARGVKRGESVALCMPNSKRAVICLFGVIYGGFRATTLNLAAGPQALGHAIDHSQCRVAFVDEKARALFSDALAICKNRPEQIVTGPDIDLPEGTSAPMHDVAPDDHALLMYTSGTTGLPKGVVHTQASLLAGGWTSALAHALGPEDRAYCVLPFYHINGLCVTLIAPLISGGSVIMVERFSGSRFWADCDEHEATWFSIVPTIVSHLLHKDADPSGLTKERIRFGRSASAPLSPEVQMAFEERFSIPIVETMGLTETAAQILSNPLPPGVRKIGSPGVAIGNQVEILGQDQKPVARGERGEIAVYGPNVMQQYLFNEAATSECLTVEGWLRSGDLGYMDEDGYVFVTGRLKELIIKGGENIAPREIDEALYCHPDVVEAAAFGQICKIYGQKIAAAVSVSENSTIGEQDLLAICEERLGSFKSPEAIYFLDELPKGPSGKIQRRHLEMRFSKAGEGKPG